VREASRQAAASREAVEEPGIAMSSGARGCTAVVGTSDWAIERSGQTVACLSGG